MKIEKKDVAEEEKQDQGEDQVMDAGKDEPAAKVSLRGIILAYRPKHWKPAITGVAEGGQEAVMAGGEEYEE